jgi:hypothetical protein
MTTKNPLLDPTGPGVVLLLLVLGLSLSLIFSCIQGCSEIRVPPDAPSDAALVEGCGTLRNTLETVAPECPWRTWGCPFAGPVAADELESCNLALYESRDAGCDALELVLDSCSTSPTP